MSNRCTRVFWSAVVLSVFILFGLQGCGSKSGPTIPGYGNFPSNQIPDDGIFRMFFWSTGTDDDEDIAATADIEKNADITNVVWGHYWNFYNRHGKFKTTGQGNDVHGTIVAYQQSDASNVDTDIYFRACYRDDDGPDQVSSAIQVDTTNADEVQIFPAATAHLDAGYKLVVDIVYLKMGTYVILEDVRVHYRIMHCRYKEQNAGQLNFTEIQAEEINPSCVVFDSYFHPDIVYDAGTPDEGDFLHVVYTHAEWSTADERDICYMRGEEGNGDVMDWPADVEYLNDTNYDYLNIRPRIDVGVDSYLDDAGYEYSIVENDVTTFIPYVGVVWEQNIYESLVEEWYTDIVFCRLSHNDGTSGFFERDVVNNGTSATMGMPPGHSHNVFPYIDIEPRENVTTSDNSACTHICWTHARDIDVEYSGNFVTTSAVVMVINTYRFETYNHLTPPPMPGVTLIDENAGALDFNGMATLAIKVDKPSNTEEGYIAWFSVDDLSTDDPEIYAADISWADTSTWGISKSNVENISEGYSALGLQSGYSFFPEMAIQNETIGKVIWTEKSTGNEPDIWGDFSDW